jgi:aspartyl protease family protein
MQGGMQLRLILGVVLLGVSLQAGAVWVRLMGLGPNRAELQINQTPVRVMYPGQTSPEGVRLLVVTRDYVEIEANGTSHRLVLGQRVEPQVILEADARGHYATEVAINGRRVVALVDTGASTVALSRSEAERLGLDYRQGRRIKVGTASGQSEAHLVTLNEVQLGAHRPARRRGHRVGRVKRAGGCPAGHEFPAATGYGYRRSAAETDADSIARRGRYNSALERRMATRLPPATGKNFP